MKRLFGIALGMTRSQDVTSVTTNMMFMFQLSGVTGLKGVGAITKMCV